MTIVMWIRVHPYKATRFKNQKSILHFIAFVVLLTDSSYCFDIAVIRFWLKMHIRAHFWRFLGILSPKHFDIVVLTSKGLQLSQKDAFWYITRQNWSSGLTSSCAKEQTKKQHRPLTFHPFVGSPPEPIDMLFGVLSGVPDIITQAKFCVNLLKGFSVAALRKVPFPILFRTTLTTVLHYRADCDRLHRERAHIWPTCDNGITQFYLPLTHEPYLPLLHSQVSPPISWYSLCLPTKG